MYARRHSSNQHVIKMQMCSGRNAHGIYAIIRHKMTNIRASSIRTNPLRLELKHNSKCPEKYIR